MLAPALAVIISLLSAAPCAFAGNTAPPASIDWVANSGAFLALYRDVQTRAAKAYLAGEPIEQVLSGAVLQQLSGKIPPDDRAQSGIPLPISASLARDKVRGLGAVKEQAMAVQMGRHPDDPIEVHHQAIGIAAEGLMGRKPAETEKAQLIKLYGDRVRGGAAQGKPKTQAELLMDAEAARRLLADKRMSPQITTLVTTKAGQYAKELGGLLFTDGNGNAVIVGRRNPNAVLTQEELSAIAKLPRVHLPAGLGGLDRKVPAPVSAISEHAPKMGEPGFKYGWATGAWKYWNDMEKRQDDVASEGHWIQAGTVATGAKIMKFFYHAGGGGAIEESADQLRWDHNRLASAGTQIWDGTKLAGNMVMSALTFVPGVEMLRGATLTGKAMPYARAVATGESLGIARAEAGAAQAVEKGLTEVVKQSTKEGGHVFASKQAEALTTGLQKYAKDGYGLTLEVSDGSSLAKNLRQMNLKAAWQDIRSLGAAESTSVDRMTVNTAIGKAHEPVHALQMVQTRATLLESYARKTGAESFAALSDVQKAEAMRAIAPEVSRLEKVTSIFEAGANDASGFGGGTFRWGYEQSLLKNVSTFRQGLTSGTMPSMPFSLRAQVYGDLPMVLGTSQKQIAKTITAGILAGRDGIADLQNGDHPYLNKAFSMLVPGDTSESNYVPQKQPIRTKPAPKSAGQ